MSWGFVVFGFFDQFGPSEGARDACEGKKCRPSASRPPVDLALHRRACPSSFAPAWHQLTDTYPRFSGCRRSCIHSSRPYPTSILAILPLVVPIIGLLIPSPPLPSIVRFDLSLPEYAAGLAAPILPSRHTSSSTHLEFTPYRAPSLDFSHSFQESLAPHAPYQTGRQEHIMMVVSFLFA